MYYNIRCYPFYHYFTDLNTPQETDTGRHVMKILAPVFPLVPVFCHDITPFNSTVDLVCRAPCAHRMGMVAFGTGFRQGRYVLDLDETRRSIELGVRP